MDGYQRASIQSQWGGRGPPRDRETDMPSFDIVSEVDLHAFTNAVDQAQRVVDTRFDFKGVEAGFEREGHQCTLTAEAVIQLGQIMEMLRADQHRSSSTQLGMVVSEDTCHSITLWKQTECAN